MGKPTGFMDYKREIPRKEPVSERIKNFKSSSFPSLMMRQKYREPVVWIAAFRFATAIQDALFKITFRNGTTLSIKDTGKKLSKIFIQTNNFPEFTGRLCPAPCESACTLGINGIPCFY